MEVPAKQDKVNLSIIATFPKFCITKYHKGVSSTNFLCPC